MSFTLLFLLGAAFNSDDAASDKPSKQKTTALRSYYAETAAKYEFFRDANKQEPLKLMTNPVMTWSMDNDWSGDVFVWTHAQRPEVIGCILTSPETKNTRQVYQEFHLLSEQPIAACDLLGGARWVPKEGLKLLPAEGAAKPAETAALRLSQMRAIVRDFSAKMQAEGEWELRLLPQPLLRYQPTAGPSIDGALFAYVWPKGTDPELILLVECRKTDQGLAWFYSPARFSTRELWLNYREKETWRVPALHGKNKPETYITLPLGDYKAEAVPKEK